MSFKHRGALEKQAKEQGITVIELCERAIAEYGTKYKAAIALGVYENAIRYHLKRTTIDARAAQDKE